MGRSRPKRYCPAGSISTLIKGAHYRGFTCILPAHSPTPIPTTKALLLTAANFLASRAPLRTGHAVAALLVLEDGRYIMHFRDDVPIILSPGHWGLFGRPAAAREEEIPPQPP